MTRALRRVLGSVLPNRLRRWIQALGALSPAARVIYVRRALTRVSRELPEGLGPGRDILFICFGNIMRSPMAAAVLRAELARHGVETLRVRSAGVRASAVPRAADPSALLVSRRLGFSLDDHQSQQVQPEAVATAGLIVIMDEMHGAMLLERFREVEPRVRLLGAFDPEPGSEGAELPDPYGRGEVATEDCFRRIVRATRSLAVALVPAGGSAPQRALP